MTTQEHKAIAKVVGDKKAKEIKEALAKSKATKKAKTPRVTIDGVTMELLKKPGGVTKKEIVTVLVKKFPKHDKETLGDTTRRRLNGYLQRIKNVTIKKDDNGKYKIVTKTAKKSPDKPQEKKTA
jgi:hypothetical protein